MKQGMIDHQHVKHVLAAAVLAALGSTAAAQQPGSELSQDQPGAQPQQQQQEQQSQQEESELQSAAAESESGGSSVLDQIAQEHDDLSTFIEAVKAAGMEESLTGGTEYTVFAPTNDAFESMSGMTRDELLAPENREELLRLLRAHIVADDLDRDMAGNIPEARTIDGGTVPVAVDGEEFTVGDASVVEPDIRRGNLRVHVVDGLLARPIQVAEAEPAATSEQESTPVDSGPQSTP